MKYKLLKQETLLEALANLSPNSSKTSLRSWLKEGRVTVDGRVEKVATLQILPGQIVALGEKHRVIPGGIKIYYEDKHLIVIEKPSGLLSVSTDFETQETAHAILKKMAKPRRVFVVHRIDQDTSGVMIFTFSEEARDALKETFEIHDIERRYVGIVEGTMESHQGKWESYVYEDANYVVRSTHDPSRGKLAITHYEVKYTNKRYSWLDLKLETGRKNQIRVHCQDAGHPIVGDSKYGAVSNPLKRLCLHAYLLTFKHPITGQSMRFESPVPQGFNQLFNLIG